MTKEEAIVIAHSAPEFIVEVLLHMSARIEDLERKVALLTRDSSNSSKPPSSDGPGGAPKARPPMKSKKRKAGGQPGHKGSTRKLVPVEDVDRVIPVFPDSCDHGGVFLTPGPDCSSGKYWRHQVIDIPEPKAEVAEYHLHCVRCSCGGENWGKLPQTARSGFGPRLTALLAHLTGLHRVTRRGCQEIAKTIFGIDICLGSVCTLHREVSESLSGAYKEAREALPEQPNLNIDETGWKTQGQARWLWGVVAPGYEYFHVAASRGAKVLREILGDVYEGILCSDMYSAYKAFHHGVRQFCWAHSIRGIKGIKHACRSPDAVRFSKWMLAEIGRMFALWHAFQDSDMERQALIRKSVPLRSRMSRCLQLHRTSSDSDVAKLAKSLLKHWHGLFTFLEYRGIEPTNNAPERALRPAVQWRKICFGNQSQEGELLTARLLTAERSSIRQGRNAFRFLVDSIIAYRNSLPGSSLLRPSC